MHTCIAGARVYESNALCGLWGGSVLRLQQLCERGWNVHRYVQNRAAGLKTGGTGLAGRIEELSVMNWRHEVRQLLGQETAPFLLLW